MTTPTAKTTNPKPTPLLADDEIDFELGRLSTASCVNDDDQPYFADDDEPSGSLHSAGENTPPQSDDEQYDYDYGFKRRKMNY